MGAAIDIGMGDVEAGGPLQDESNGFVTRGETAGGVSSFLPLDGGALTEVRLPPLGSCLIVLWQYTF